MLSGYCRTSGINLSCCWRDASPFQWDSPVLSSCQKVADKISDPNVSSDQVNFSCFLKNYKAKNPAILFWSGFVFVGRTYLIKAS